MRIIFDIYRILIIFLVLLGLVFIVGTIYGVFFLPNPPGLVQAEGLPNNTQNNVQNNLLGQTFTGIGLLRVTTVDPEPGIVVLFVLFTYFPEDKAFSEELALRVKDFREIIVSYIGSFSLIDLQNQGEEIIKTELLHRFNAILRLGQIETLYFSDFMIVG